MHDLLKNWHDGHTDWVDPVFSYAPLLLLTVDNDLTIVHVSKHLLEEFGFKKPDLVGQKLSIFIGDSTDTIWPRLVMPSIQNDFQIHETETEFSTSTGERVPVLFSAASKANAGDHQPVALVIMSQQRATAHEIVNTNQSTKDFFRTVNHELRTPMNAIMGMNALLLASPLDYQQHELATKIQSASEAMMLLIDSLVDEQSSPSSPADVVASEFELRAFVDTVVNHWLPIAEDRGLIFNLTYESGLPQKIRSDAKRLAKTINTLLGNAIKQTSSGAVSLQVSPLDVVGTASHVAFDVQDSNDSGKASLPSHDMSICQELCLELGGTLDANPVWSGEGLYTITIPTGMEQVDSDEPVAADDQHHTTNNQFAGCKVLVVEDNQLNQALLRSILDSIGLKCHLADTGEQAVALCEQNDYDLIFMDIQMPGMNGVTTAKMIRSKLPQYEYCPIIAVTANALKSAKDNYLREGLDGYIAKPYSPNDIRRITAQIISNAA